MPTYKSPKEVQQAKEAAQEAGDTEAYDLSETLLHLTRFLESFLHNVHDPNGTRYFTGLSLRSVAWCRDWEAEIGTVDGNIYKAVMKPARMMYDATLKYQRALTDAQAKGYKPDDDEIAFTLRRVSTDVNQMLKADIIVAL